MDATEIRIQPVLCASGGCSFRMELYACEDCKYYRVRALLNN